MIITSSHIKLYVIITMGDNMTREEMDNNHKFNEPSYLNDPTASFSDFINNPAGNKFVIVITKNQYVFNASSTGDHVYMVADLIRKIRPNLETADMRDVFDLDEKFGENNVLVFGFPDYTLISIPEEEMLSVEQYEIIEGMLHNIKEENEKKKNTSSSPWELFIEAPKQLELNGDHLETKIDEVLERLRNYVIDEYEKPDEVIIGRPLSKGKKL